MALTTVQGELLESGSALENIGAGNITPSYLDTQAQYTGFKNRIINGAMVIDQRNAGASVTPTTSGYTLDRYTAQITQASKISVQQNAGSVTPPAGFTNYLGVTSTSAYSVVSSDFFLLSQPIEAYNMADFGWGGSNATAATLSFWVRSSLTGTFGGALENGTDRSFPFSYTISSANTWEQKTISITAPASGGTWGTTNGVGVFVRFGLGVGSDYSATAGSWTSSRKFSATGATSVVGTNGATWYITGVQLEKGSTATSFDYRPYGTELMLCQRYFLSLNSRITNAGDSCFAYGLTAGDATYHNLITYLAQPMRTAPTLAINNLQISDGWDYGVAVTSLWYSNQNTPDIVKFGVRTGSGATARRGAFLSGTYQATDSYLNMSAEL